MTRIRQNIAIADNAPAVRDEAESLLGGWELDGLAGKEAV